MKNTMSLSLVAFSILIFRASATCQNILYEEHFTDGNPAIPWFAGFGGDTLKPHMMFDNPSGDWWVGRLNNQASGGGVGLSFGGTPELADYSLEAWVYCPVGPSEYHGIQVRIDSSANAGYQLLTDFDSDKRLRFRYAVGASPYVIHDFTAAEIPGRIPAESGWHKMKMKAVGFDFWLYWDDQELPGCPYLDGSAQAGFFGFYVWNFTDEADTFCDDIIVRDESGTATEGGNEDKKVLPEDFVLEQNYPNPFNSTTVIGYHLPRASCVEMAIYNASGQRVRLLVDEVVAAGHHQVTWDGGDDLGHQAASGLYFCRMRAGDQAQITKMILMR
jgi:hypothetical protein